MGPRLLIVPGVVLPHSPSPTISHQTEVGGEQGAFCRFVKTLKSGVCTICAALFVWDRRKLNQESIVFRDCFSRKKNNNLVPYVINHLLPPLVPQSSPPIFPLLTRVPQLPQVLLESALKHWSRVKRYVAQDGSG